MKDSPDPTKLPAASARHQPASRANGAKSRGPVTEQGKRNSCLNATTQCMLAKSVVLPGEDRTFFLALLADFRAAFCPASAAADALVEVMAVSHWRQRRVWSLETSSFQDEIEKRPADIAPALRASRAFHHLADNSRVLDLINRYELRFDRQFHRALAALLKLQSLPDPGPSAPNTDSHPDTGPTSAPNEPSNPHIPNGPAEPRSQDPQRLRLKPPEAFPAESRLKARSAR